MRNLIIVVMHIQAGCVVWMCKLQISEAIKIKHKNLSTFFCLIYADTKVPMIYSCFFVYSFCSFSTKKKKMADKILPQRVRKW